MSSDLFEGTVPAFATETASVTDDNPALYYHVRCSNYFIS
jgi:hypothetical protein